MLDQRIDLTGGHVKAYGNKDDEHIFRLNNPTGETIINASGTYEAEFISAQGKVTSVPLDLTELASGVLSFPLTIANGTYKVRLVLPRRTLLMVEVEAR